MKVVLPWPDNKLSPNARIHWKTRNNRKKKARKIGKEIGEKYDPGGLPEGDLECTILFYPPSRRKYDWVNVAAAMKSYEDGLFEAWEMDDVRVRRATVERMEVIEDGKIEYVLESFSDGQCPECKKRNEFIMKYAGFGR